MGSSGKTSAATIAGARPATATATTAATAAAKAAPAAPAAVATPPATTSRPTTASQVSRPAAVALKATQSKEEVAVAPGPSLEFLKWLSDSLGGLNKSVNRKWSPVPV